MILGGDLGSDFGAIERGEGVRFSLILKFGVVELGAESVLSWVDAVVKYT